MTHDLFTDAELPRIFKRWQESERQAELRRQFPYLEDLIAALLPYKHGCHKSWVVDHMEKTRRKRGMLIPPEFDAAVRHCFQWYCRGCKMYQKRGAPPDEGLFVLVSRGNWKLDREALVRWILKQTT